MILLFIVRIIKQKSSSFPLRFHCLNAQLNQLHVLVIGLILIDVTLLQINGETVREKRGFEGPLTLYRRVLGRSAQPCLPCLLFYPCLFFFSHYDPTLHNCSLLAHSPLPSSLLIPPHPCWSWKRTLLVQIVNKRNFAENATKKTNNEKNTIHFTFFFINRIFMKSV